MKSLIFLLIFLVSESLSACTNFYQKYENIELYEDRGRIVRYEFSGADEKPVVIDVQRFSTSYKRGRNLTIKWDGIYEFRGINYDMKANATTLQRNQEMVEIDSIERAFVKSVGVSGGAASAIPSLLLREERFSNKLKTLDVECRNDMTMPIASYRGMNSVIVDGLDKVIAIVRSFGELKQYMTIIFYEEIAMQ